jgi:hypothetical protein
MALILDIEGGSQINIWTSKQLTLGIPVDKIFLRLPASIEATRIGFISVDNLTSNVLPDIKVLIKMLVLCFGLGIVMFLVVIVLPLKAMYEIQLLAHVNFKCIYVL